MTFMPGETFPVNLWEQLIPETDLLHAKYVKKFVIWLY